MSGKQKANRRRQVAAHPDLNPEMRWYLAQLNKKGVTYVWGTTTSTTTTTTTTT